MRAVVSLVLLAVAWAGPASGGQPPSKKAAQHLRVLMSVDQGRIQVERVDRVAGPLPKRRGQARFHPWRLRALDKQGQEIQRLDLDDPTVVRGEFQNPEDPDRIDAVHVKRESKVYFSVRLEQLDTARLQLLRLKPGTKRQPKPPAEAFESLGSIALPDAGSGR